MIRLVKWMFLALLSIPIMFGKVIAGFFKAREVVRSGQRTRRVKVVR